MRQKDSQRVSWYYRPRPVHGDLMSRWALMEALWLHNHFSPSDQSISNDLEQNDREVRVGLYFKGMKTLINSGFIIGLI